MSLLTLLALACTPPEPAKPDATDAPAPTAPEPGTPEPSTTDEDPCEPSVGALLFDLGETLVTQQGDVFVLRPDTLEMVQALQELGLPIGIVTNTLASWDEQDLRDLLVNPELLDEFDLVLLSSEADSPPKPDPAIFVEAHGLLPGAPPIERVAFVTEETGDLADQASAPTEGARAAGLVGVLLSESPSPLADHQVSSLAEIPTAPWLHCGR
jgi:hypothetical protein